MGRRSRKRGGDGEVRADVSGGASRAERDLARRRRAQEASAAASKSRPAGRSSRGSPGVPQRPPAPWGNFPLVEVVVLLAFAIGITGLFTSGRRGVTMLVAAAALGSLAGLEISIREHVAGFRSHTTVLAGAAAIAAMVGLFFAAGSGGIPRGLLLLTGVAVFAAAWWSLREVFKRRSGGLGFRVR